MLHIDDKYAIQYWGRILRKFFMNLLSAITWPTFTSTLPQNPLEPSLPPFKKCPASIPALTLYACS